MEFKLFDSELKIMEFLWKQGEATAKEIAVAMADITGWSKTTTYTVLKKCVEKGAIRRQEPGFHCTPLISREQVQAYETQELLDKFYGGTADQLVASLLGQQKLSAEELQRLKVLIQSYE